MFVGRSVGGAVAGLVMAGLLLVAGSSQMTTWAAPVAQDVPPPPDLGATQFQSALTSPEVFAPGSCPSGAASGENVDEGFKLSVRGRCVPEASAANLPVPSRQISVWDGDIALDFKVVAGAERAGINLYARIQSGTYMAAYLSLAAGRAELFRRESGENTIVASTEELGELDATNWNRLALRLRGGEIWLLVNDVPLLHAADVLNQDGGIGIAVVREGNVDDQDEVAVVFRDLALTSLEAPPGEEVAPASEESAPAPDESESAPAPNPALHP